MKVKTVILVSERIIYRVITSLKPMNHFPSDFNIALSFDYSDDSHTLGYEGALTPRIMKGNLFLNKLHLSNKIH